MMNKVQSRFLQAVLSPVSGDKVTVGIIHWDGSEMRTALSFRGLPKSLGRDRQAIRDTVRALLAQAGRASTGRQGCLFGIDQVFRVREGLGARLLWTEVRNARTSDPEAHFEELRHLVGLDRVRSSAVRGERLAKQSLLAAAEKLAAKAEDRVRMSNTVRNKHAFVSPLSWRNGAWNHTVVASFAQHDEEAIRRRTHNLLGMLQLALPARDHAVVVAVVPDPSNPMATVAAEEAALLESWTKNTEVVSAAAGRATKVVDDLIARVCRDVGVELG